jgi:hypothetical protein
MKRPCRVALCQVTSDGRGDAFQIEAGDGYDGSAIDAETAGPRRCSVNAFDPFAKIRGLTCGEDWMGPVVSFGPQASSRYGLATISSQRFTQPAG